MDKWFIKHLKSQYHYNCVFTTLILYCLHFLKAQFVWVQKKCCHYVKSKGSILVYIFWCILSTVGSNKFPEFFSIKNYWSYLFHEDVVTHQRKLMFSKNYWLRTGFVVVWFISIYMDWANTNTMLLYHQIEIYITIWTWWWWWRRQQQRWQWQQ